MAHSKLYVKIMNSKQWRQLRRHFLTDHPLCQSCFHKQPQLIRSARCIHHVIPIESARTEEEAKALAFNTGNLQALCFECHAEIHKAERSHSGEAHKQREADRLQQWISKHTTNHKQE